MSVDVAIQELGSISETGETFLSWLISTDPIIFKRYEFLEQVGAPNDLARKASSLEKPSSKAKSEQGAAIHATGFALHNSVEKFCVLSFLHAYQSTCQHLMPCRAVGLWVCLYDFWIFKDFYSDGLYHSDHRQQERQAATSGLQPSSSPTHLSATKPSSTNRWKKTIFGLFWISRLLWLSREKLQQSQHHQRRQWRWSIGIFSFKADLIIDVTGFILSSRWLTIVEQKTQSLTQGTSRILSPVSSISRNIPLTPRLIVFYVKLTYSSLFYI